MGSSASTIRGDSSLPGLPRADAAKSCGARPPLVLSGRRGLDEDGALVPALLVGLPVRAQPVQRREALRYSDGGARDDGRDAEVDSHAEDAQIGVGECSGNERGRASH